MSGTAQRKEQRPGTVAHTAREDSNVRWLDSDRSTIHQHRNQRGNISLRILVRWLDIVWNQYRSIGGSEKSKRKRNQVGGVYEMDRRMRMWAYKNELIQFFCAAAFLILMMVIVCQGVIDSV